MIHFEEEEGSNRGLIPYKGMKTRKRKWEKISVFVFKITQKNTVTKNKGEQPKRTLHVVPTILDIRKTVI